MAFTAHIIPPDLSQSVAFLEHNPNPVISLDCDGSVTYLNATARSRFPKLGHLSDNHPVLEGLGQVLTQLAENPDDTIVYVREVTFGGLVYEQQVLSLPGLATMFLYFIEITERKRASDALQSSATSLAKANQSLKVMNEELRRQNAELDEFAHVASHDLQEPLRKLISFSGALRDDFPDELPQRATDDLKYITDAAKRMHTLVNDLLQLSRAGRSEMKNEFVHLEECTQNALRALSSRIEETQAKITCNKLPCVSGDPILLTQLFQNLIANALKFVPSERSPVIEITAEQIGNEWILGVRDNGIGIPTEYQQQIFAPFKRLHGRSEYEGTGIGLSICRKAVERHRGKIWVESKPGMGSHFRVSLPVSSGSDQ